MTDKALLPGLRRALYILGQYWEPAAIIPAFDDILREIRRIELTETGREKARAP